MINANVLFPILVDGHAHLVAAMQWWDSCEIKHRRANIEDRQHAPDLRTDAWLAALVQIADCQMTPFNRDFKPFPKLKLHLLLPLPLPST